MKIGIRAEQLAYWYLRLNGFLTIQNFIVHPQTGSNQRTDIDVLGVRFPYRSELSPHPMIDEGLFLSIKDKPYIVIAEVKRACCRLNASWTNSKRGNLQRVLRAIGTFPECEVEEVAKVLYASGIFENEKYYVTLACFGECVDSRPRYTDIPQILWDNVLDFIYRRFQTYSEQKRSHSQWDKSAQNLWDCYEEDYLDVESFKQNVTILDR